MSNIEKVVKKVGSRILCSHVFCNSTRDTKFIRLWGGRRRGSPAGTDNDSANRVVCGEPDVCHERWEFNAHLVLDECDVLFRLGRVVG